MKGVADMDNKILEKTTDAIEEVIKPIIVKGAQINAAELEVLTKAICALEKIKQIEDAETYGNSFAYIRRPVEVPNYSTRRYYDGEHHNNYSGHSIKDRMVAQLEKMYDEANTEHERQTVNDWIRILENAK